MYPVYMMMELCRHQWAGSTVILHTDNTGVLYSLRGMSSTDRLMMRLIRRIVLICLLEDIKLKVYYVESKKNAIADALSRNLLQKFRQLHPSASQFPMPVPDHVLPQHFNIK